MWKVALILLLPGLMLAQSANEPLAPKAVDPLAGVTFWPKAKSGLPTSAAPLNGIRVWNFPYQRSAFNNALTYSERMDRTPASPEIGRCAIPLLKLRIPADRNYTILRFAPTPFDGNFVATPAVPSCER